MRIKHHISGLYRKILTPVIGIPVLLLGMLFVYALNTWNTGYDVDKYTVENILGGNGGAYCIAVDNQCPVGTGIFVPTYTDAEWFGPNGFIYKKPTCINLLPCACKVDSECGNYKCVGYVPAAGGTPATCSGSFLAATDACNSENANSIMSKTVSGVTEYIEFTNSAWRGWFETQGYTGFSNVATKLGCAGVQGQGSVCTSRNFLVSKFYETNTYTYQTNITRSCYPLKKNDRAQCVTLFTDYSSCTAVGGCSWVPQVGGSVEVMGHCGLPDGCKTDSDCIAGKICSGYITGTVSSILYSTGSYFPNSPERFFTGNAGIVNLTYEGSYTDSYVVNNSAKVAILKAWDPDWTWLAVGDVIDWSTYFQALTKLGMPSQIPSCAGMTCNVGTNHICYTVTPTGTTTNTNYLYASYSLQASSTGLCKNGVIMEQDGRRALDPIHDSLSTYSSFTNSVTAKSWCTEYANECRSTSCKFFFTNQNTCSTTPVGSSLTCNYTVQSTNTDNKYYFNIHQCVGPNTSETLGQCVPNSGCKTDSDCTAVGGVCNGYVAPTNSPTSVCLHWEKNMSELNTSISLAELQGCVNSLSYSGIPSIPSFAPTYAGQIENSATSFWNGIFFRSCTYNEGAISGYGDVYREAIPTPATSCATQTSNGVACTAYSCKFVPPYSTPEVMGQCGCKANSDCGNTNLCAGSVAPSVGYCNGTYTSTVTTPGTCKSVARCGDPGCSDYTNQASCAGPGPQECTGPAGECGSNHNFLCAPACSWTDGQTSYPQYNCSLSFSTPSSCNAQYGCSWIDPISAVPGQCVQPTTSLRIDGSCKQYISVLGYSSQPATSTALGCDAGVYQDAADTNVYWNWKCLGLNGGESRLCSTVPLNSQPGQEDYGWCCENTQDQSVSEWCYPCS